MRLPFTRRRTPRQPPTPPRPVALPWPEPPRLRPLRAGEQLPDGATVYVEGDAAPHTWRAWMHCGSDRYAMLDGQPVFLVRHERLLRVRAEDERGTGKGGKSA